MAPPDQVGHKKKRFVIDLVIAGALVVSGVGLLSLMTLKPHAFSQLTEAQFAYACLNGAIGTARSTALDTGQTSIIVIPTDKGGIVEVWTDVDGDGVVNSSVDSMVRSPQFQLPVNTYFESAPRRIYVSSLPGEPLRVDREVVLQDEQGAWPYIVITVRDQGGGRPFSMPLRVSHK